MTLKAQDVGVALKIAITPVGAVASPTLALELGISKSEVNNAILRCLACRLLTHDLLPSHAARSVGRPKRRLLVNTTGLEEFVVHGLKYVFVPVHGPLVRGVPTAHGTSPLDSLINSTEAVPVWPFARGNVRGESFSPLFRSAPFAALRDPAYHSLLALVDAIRGGRARERTLAAELIVARLKERPRA